MAKKRQQLNLSLFEAAERDEAKEQAAQGACLHPPQFEKKDNRVWPDAPQFGVRMVTVCGICDVILRGRCR